MGITRFTHHSSTAAALLSLGLCIAPAAASSTPASVELVPVPAGRLTMASSVAEGDATGSSVREVQVPAFRLMKHEVTVGEYRRFAEATARQPTGACRRIALQNELWDFSQSRLHNTPGFPQGDDHPMVCVSWEDANAYAVWLAGKTGIALRLPTEAEWEYAARGALLADSTPPLPAASAAEVCLHANVDGPAFGCDDGHEYTAPVQSYRANAFGLHDMLGNAWEWTADCWHENYDGAPADGSAWIDGGDCSQRVTRGGSWFDTPSYVGFAVRFALEPHKHFDNLGFRLAAPAE